MPSTANPPVLPVYLKTYCGITWPGWISIFIWTPIILVLSILTVNDFIPLLNDYNINNINVQLTVNKDETIQRPNDMTACVPYHSRELVKIIGELEHGWIINRTINCRSFECQAMVNHSWDVWKIFNFTNAPVDYPDSRLSNAIAVGIVKKVLNDSDGLRALHLRPSNFNWNQPIVDAVWYFLSCVSRLGLNILNSTSLPHLSGEIECVFDFTDTEFESVSNRVIDEMYQLVLNAIKVYFSVYGDTIDETRAMSFWGDRLCIRLQPNSSYDYLEFRSFFDADFKPPWKRLKPPLRRIVPFQIFEDSTPLYWFPMVFEDSLYSTDETKMDQITNEAVHLTYSIESRVLENRTKKIGTCSEINTPAACVAENQLGLAIQECNCVPFALRLFLKNGTRWPYCNLMAYRSCKEKLDRKNEIFWAKCQNKCVDTIYKWKQEVAVKNDQSDKLMFFYEFRAKQTTFIEFSLTDKITFQQFLSQVGGLANLYLGLSGLTVCTILLFCIDLIKRWNRLRTRSTSREQNSDSLWQVFRIKTFVRMLQSRDDKNKVNDQTDLIRKEIHQLKKELSLQLQAQVQVVKENFELETQTMKETFAMKMRLIEETLAAETQEIKQAMAAHIRVGKRTKKLLK